MLLLQLRQFMFVFHLEFCVLVLHLDLCMLVPQLYQFFTPFPQLHQFVMLVSHLDQFCMLVPHLDQFFTPDLPLNICSSTSSLVWHRTWKHQPLVGWLHFESHTCKKTSLPHLQRNIVINIFTADNCLNKARTIAKPECFPWLVLLCLSIIFYHQQLFFLLQYLLLHSSEMASSKTTMCLDSSMTEGEEAEHASISTAVYCLFCTVVSMFRSEVSFEAVKAKRPGNISWSWDFVIYWARLFTPRISCTFDTTSVLCAKYTDQSLTSVFQENKNKFEECELKRSFNI